MATKKTISDISPVAPNDSPVASKTYPAVEGKLSVYETALKLIAEGNAMDKNDLSIQIAIKALSE